MKNRYYVSSFGPKKDTSTRPLILHAMLYFKKFEQENRDIWEMNQFKDTIKYQDRPPGTICYVLRKKVKEPLGQFSNAYYYLIAKKYWYKKWASEDHADISKYDGKDGFTTQSRIIDNMYAANILNMTCLVLAMPKFEDKDKPIQEMHLDFHYIEYGVMKSYLDRYRKKAEYEVDIEGYKSKQIAFPRELLTPIDPFREYDVIINDTM